MLITSSVSAPFTNTTAILLYGLVVGLPKIFTSVWLCASTFSKPSILKSVLSLDANTTALAPFFSNVRANLKSHGRVIRILINFEFPLRLPCQYHVV
jgi:hypothetical protein